MKTAWTTAREKSDVWVRWHDVRHTSVTRLLEQNVSLPMIGAILGWSASTIARMALRYGHVGIDAKRGVMERLVRPEGGAQAEPTERKSAVGGDRR